MRRHRKTLTLALAGLIVAGSISGCATADGGERLARPMLSSITGSVETVNFDEGYITFGAGPEIVDLYIDPLCPYCKLFESLNGDFSFTEAEENQITLRVHPVAILNRYSNDTDYSARSAAMLMAVAESNPESSAAFISALFDSQPQEHTGGLSDGELKELAFASGAQAPNLARLKKLQRWVDEQAEKATATELADGAGTPTHVPWS